MLQCVAVGCSGLQCAAVCYSSGWMLNVAGCCSVLQWVAVGYSVLQYVIVLVGCLSCTSSCDWCLVY